jgi:hypothetical protein
MLCSGPSLEKSPPLGEVSDGLHVRLPLRGCGVGGLSLPDVGPAWWDNESEGVYSEDPEDGYPYDQ